MRRILQPSLLLALGWLSSSATGKQFGIQTGMLPSSEEDTGSSYAGSMAYDADNEVLFLTGSTYGTFFSRTESNTPTSNCFLGVLSLASDPPTWLHTSRLGTITITESCSSLTKIDATKIYIGGQSEEGGLLTGLRPPGSKRALQYGWVGDFDIDLRDHDSAEPSTVQFRGGRLVHSSNVQSVAALASTTLGNTVFVASHASDETTHHSSYNTTTAHPNFSTGGVTKYGSNYFVEVMRLPTLGGGSSSPMIGQTLGNPGWRREIATDQSVEVAALELVNPSTLILAGTAKGSDTQAIPADGITRNTDYDGFVTMLDPADGLILGTLRVQSELGKQDRVEAMCFQEGTVTNPEYIYLVGSTTGIMDAAIDERDQETYSAFIMQVSVPNLEVVSTAQLIAQFGPLSSNPSGPQMRGLACAVTSDGADVYVGGVVEEGSVVVADGQTTSSGRDDVFVAQFSTRTSDWEFVQQFGSNRDDSLVDIAVDKYDNAVVLGNTMGSLMREKTSPETTSDVFVVSVARNTGEYEASAGGGFARHGSTHPPGVVATIPPDVRSPSPAPATGDGGGRLNGGLVAVLVVMSVCGTLIACFYCRRSMTQDIYTDRDQVLEYLKGFDDVEVDLKHSATGGWHGTYINHDGAPRYFSDNHMPDTITFSGSEMSPLTHNEIVQDSLFTDDYEEPQLGGARGGVRSSGAVMQDDDVVLERPPSTYGGLVDAYNTTWDDMNPYALPGSKRNSAASHRASVSSSGGTPRQSFQGLRDVNINEDEPWGNEII